MRNRSFRFPRPTLVGALLALSTVALLLPPVASAQQSLVDRLVPVYDDICNGPSIDNTLQAAACGVAGITPDEQEEVVSQLSGNAAAAAGSNATQTTNAQVKAQSSRLSEIRAQGGASSGLRSGNDGGYDDSRVGGFFNFFGGLGNTQQNGEEPGFKYDGGGFTTGLDVRLNDNVVVGGGFGWNRQTTDYDSNSSVFSGGGTVGGGDLDTDAFVFSLFGSWFDGPIYLDAMLSYTYLEYESKRDINDANTGTAGTADSDTDANQAGVVLGAGYQMQYEGFSLGPVARMNYLYTKINNFNENGFALALSYENQEIETLTTSFGGEVYYPISTSAGVFTPHVRLTWEHELMDDPRKIRARYVLDDSGNDNAITTETKQPDRNFGRLSIGAAAQLKGGVAGFVDYETVLGLAHTEAHKFTAGARIEF
jgi:outer membrane lipase/esterase